MFRTINPCHGSIVRKRSGGKRQAEMVVSPFSVRKAIPGVFFARISFGLGSTFVYRFVECSNHGGGKRKEAIDRTISAMMGISVMVEIVLR
jgi:hypothetical protein